MKWTVAVRDAIGYKYLKDKEQFDVNSIREKYPQIFDG
jgi:hypothetical protein